MRRNLIAAVILLAVIGLAWLAYRESGRVRVVGEPSGAGAQLTLPSGHAGTVVWIESAVRSPNSDGTGPDRVMLARRWRSPRQIASGSEVTAVAVDGSRVLVAGRQTGQDAMLTTIDIGSGKQETLATVKGRAEGVAAAGGLAAWIERRGAAVPAAPFVAAAAPVTVIRSTPENPSGRVTVVAVLDTDPTRGDAARPDLLGLRHRRVYWLEHQGRDEGSVTLIRSADAGGGAPETLVSEPGVQEAVLLDDSLAWTCASVEVAAGDSRAVKRMMLAGSEQDAWDAAKPQVIADWLSGSMQLLGSGAKAYAQDKELLWRLGDRRGEQKVLYTRPGSVASGVVIGDDEYVLLRERKQAVIAKRPLTWWARVRHLCRG
jgi:hypothetical protein